MIHFAHTIHFHTFISFKLFLLLALFILTRMYKPFFIYNVLIKTVNLLWKFKVKWAPKRFTDFFLGLS